MEQEQDYIPYHDRSLDELRHDINLKAEKLVYQFKKGDLVFVVLLVILAAVLGALNWHYKWIELNWWAIGAVLCLLVLDVIVFMQLNKHFLKNMKNAGDAKQHLRAAKQLKRSIQFMQVFAYIFGSICGILLYAAVMRSYEDVLSMVIFIAIVVVILLLVMLFKPNAFVDRDFCEDLEELKEAVFDN